MLLHLNTALALTEDRVSKIEDREIEDRKIARGEDPPRPLREGSSILAEPRPRERDLSIFDLSALDLRPRLARQLTRHLREGLFLVRGVIRRELTRTGAVRITLFVLEVAGAPEPGTPVTH